MNSKIAVLVIEDNDSDFALITRELERSGFKVDAARVDSAELMQEALRQKKWDIVISDYLIPGFGGEEALEELKKSDLDIPFILISGTVGEEHAVNIMRKGASDYLMKDKLTRLGSVVDRELKEVIIRNERRQAIESLRETSLIMHHAQNLASLGSWQWDIKTNHVTWSDELYSIYGVDPLTFNATFESYLQLVHAEDRERVEKHILKALTSKSSVQFEERIVRPDGAVRHLRSWGAVLLGSDGNPTKMHGACLDITDSKRVLETLSWSEQRFKSLVANISDVITLLDIQGKILYQSASIKNVLGYDEEELVGRSVWEFVHPDDLEHVADIFKESVRIEGYSVLIEFRFKSKSGRYIQMEAQGNNQLANPAIKGVVVNSRDITERKAAEEELRAKNVQLEKTNEEIDRFVYSTSHDLRAPLLSVLGLIEMCEDFYPENEDLHALYGMMKTSIQRSDAIIKSIIDYSRNARLEVAPELLNLQEMAEGFIENIKYMEQAKGILFMVEGKAPVDFYSDRTRVFTIINNLLTNAVKYQRPESMEKKVCFEFFVEEETATIRVRDNGEGIPNEKFDSIFNMFYRLSNQSVGSGLGLYICKEMVQRLGGSIHVESKVQEGTTFTITLPNLISKAQ
ncbi:MAG: PAS domain S-box protein [Flavobacteriales bacterium]|jgi:PAS domain S-box-containing protein